MLILAVIFVWLYVQVTSLRTLRGARAVVAVWSLVVGILVLAQAAAGYAEGANLWPVGVIIFLPCLTVVLWCLLRMPVKEGE